MVAFVGRGKLGKTLKARFLIERALLAGLHRRVFSDDPDRLRQALVRLAGAGTEVTARAPALGGLPPEPPSPGPHPAKARHRRPVVLARRRLVAPPVAGPG